MQYSLLSRPSHDSLPICALICSLSVLYYDPPSFQEYVTINSQQNNVFKLNPGTLNKKNLRLVSYKILQSLINQGNSKIQGDFSEPPFLLRNFFKKFHFFYRYFFIQKITKNEILPTEQELNSIAVTTLFKVFGT